MRKLHYILASGLFLFSSLAIGQKKYQSLFWEISGNGLEDTSYLYGTMHVADERVFDFKEGVIESLNKADAYVMEMNMDSIGANLMGVLNHVLMDSSETLSSLLPETEYTKVKNYFSDSLGFPLLFFDRVLPIFTSMMLEQDSFNSDMSEALDIYFYKKAKAKDKEIIGLEGIEDQLKFFKTIPYDIQAELLVKAINDKNSVDTLSDYMLEKYVEEDLDALLKFINDQYSEGYDEFQELFEKYLITDRNINMTANIDEIINTKSSFIAVGAAHLPGEKGIIELLRHMGYVVEPK